MKKPVKNSGVQQLIGAKSFGRNGLLTDGHGELCFYLVRPTNISVLSRDSVTVQIRRLMQLLTAQPDIEIGCIDDRACFDDNKAFLKARMEEETNPKVRELLDRDLKFLDDIQMEMSTNRQFMFIVRLKNESDDQSRGSVPEKRTRATSSGSCPFTSVFHPRSMNCRTQTASTPCRNGSFPIER